MLFSRLRPEPRMDISWQPAARPRPHYERQLYEALWRYSADAQGTILASQVTLSRLDPESLEAAVDAQMYAGWNVPGWERHVEEPE